MNRIHIYLPEYVDKLLIQQSKKNKKTKSEFIRNLIIKRANNKKIKNIEEIILMNAQILLDISRVCGNLNQIAYNLNTARISQKLDFEIDLKKFYLLAEELKELTKQTQSTIKENNQILRKLL